MGPDDPPGKGDGFYRLNGAGEMLVFSAADYFAIPEEEIRGIESLLTVVGGKVVYAGGEFGALAPPPLPVSPDWSPVGRYGGYHNGTTVSAALHRQTQE